MFSCLALIKDSASTRSYTPTWTLWVATDSYLDGPHKKTDPLEFEPIQFLISGFQLEDKTKCKNKQVTKVFRSQLSAQIFFFLSIYISIRGKCISYDCRWFLLLIKAFLTSLEPHFNFAWWVLSVLYYSPTFLDKKEKKKILD